jgi:parvulin-like peptidyl-prolyl isomerase
MQEWAARKGIRTPEQLAAVCRSEAISEEDVKIQAQLPLRVALHCREHFMHRAEQRFLARKQQLDLVVYSLLRVESGPLAQELYLRIAEGEADFAELAAHYSKGPERTTRGVVGPVPILQAHPALAERLRTSRPGQLSPPIMIEQWWLVVRLEVMRPASFDEAMQERMSRELFEEWVEEQVSQLVTLRQKA